MTYAEVKSGEAVDDDIIDADDDIEDTEAREISPDEEEPIAEESVPLEGDDGAANPVETQPKKKKIGDTMPLGEALKKLLHPENEAMPEEEEEPELDDLAEEIGEIESVADMDIVAQMADEKNKAVTAAGGMTEITPDEMDAEETEEIALAADAEELFLRLKKKLQELKRQRIPGRR